jgi:hypothetical protein
VKEPFRNAEWRMLRRRIGIAHREAPFRIEKRRSQVIDFA